MVVLLGYFIAMSPGNFMEKFTGGGKGGSVHLELVIGYVKIAHCIGKLDIDDLMGTFVQRLIQATGVVHAWVGHKVTFLTLP